MVAGGDECQVGDHALGDKEIFFVMGECVSS